MKFSMKPTIPIIIATSLCIPLESHAYLGGFESEDGYKSFVNWVNGYNAGQYGTNNGGPGGGPTGGPQPPTSDFVNGLWDDVNDAFTTYNANKTVFMGGYYVTGHNTVAGLGMFPHNGDQMLALRNTSYDTPIERVEAVRVTANVAWMKRSGIRDDRYGLPVFRCAPYGLRTDLRGLS